MRKAIEILFIFLILVGCAPTISQDEFGFEVREEANLQMEFASIHVQLLMQKQSINQKWTAEQIAIMVRAFLLESVHFGLTQDVVDELSDISVFITKENSSEWVRLCEDPTGDLYQTYACSSNIGFFSETGNWQIVMRENIFQQNNTHIIEHEIAHGFLFFRGDELDINHDAPMIWEGSNPSLVNNATFLGNDLLNIN